MNNATLRKVGGIWFLSFGQMCLSFCISRRKARVPELDLAEWLVIAAIGVTLYV